MKEGIRADDFNKINDVAIFMGPIFDIYGEISLEELKALVESKERFVLIDVRDRYSYEKEHIEGAKNIPLDSIERDAPKLLNEDDRIVVYGTRGSAEGAVSADKFATIGFEKLLRYEGGVDEWKEAGLPTEGLPARKAA